MGTTVLLAADYKKAIILATPEKKYNRFSMGYYGDDKNNSIGFKFEDMLKKTFKERITHLLFNITERNRLEELSFKKFVMFNNYEAIMHEWLLNYEKIIKNFDYQKLEFFKPNNQFYIKKKFFKFVKGIIHGNNKKNK